MAASGWKSLFSHVLDAEAYKQAKYLPAGCWLEIELMETLEGESAEYLYGKDCKEAFILQGSYKNIDRVWYSNIFLVPSFSPSLPSTEYRTDWSKDHELFIVKKRSKKSVVDNKSLALDHFDWSYGSDSAFETYDNKAPEASLVDTDSELEAISVDEEVDKSWADIVEEDQVQEDQVEDDPADVQLTPSQEISPEEEFRLYEKGFWKYIWRLPGGYANPSGIADDEYEAPPGEHHALSFNGQPQEFISTTPPAVSLWAVASKKLVHWQHGFRDREGKTHDISPFSYKSILASQACKTLTPTIYDGPGSILKEHTGTALQDAVTGYATSSVLPVGSIMNSAQDPGNPHAFHIPSHNHWSSLTLPISYTIPSFFYYEADYEHRPPPFPYGPAKCEAVSCGSKLREMELCYENEDELLSSSYSSSSITSSSPASTSPPSSPPTTIASSPPLDPVVEFDTTPLTKETSDTMIAQIDADIAYFNDGEKLTALAPAAEVASRSSSEWDGKTEALESSVIEEVSGLVLPSWSNLRWLATGAVIGASLCAAWMRVKRR